MAKEDLDKYYKLLEVKPETPWEEIRRTYRGLIKVWHPDRFTDDPRLHQLAEEKTKALNVAFKMLEEDRLSIKFSYDNFGEPPEPARTTADQPSPEDIKRQAQDWFNKAKAVNPEDYRTIVDYLDRAIESDPRLEKAYVARGLARIEMKEYDLAAEDFNKALKLNSASFESIRGRAIARFEGGDYSLAIKDFTRAIEMEPAQYPHLYFYRGKAYEKAGFTAEAAMDFRKNENLLKPADGDSGKAFAPGAGTPPRSHWVTHFYFICALCLVFSLLYFSYGYLSKKTGAEAGKANVPAGTSPPVPATVEKRQANVSAKDNPIAFAEPTAGKVKTVIVPAGGKETARNRAFRVRSADENKPEPVPTDRTGERPESSTGLSRKDQKKSRAELPAAGGKEKDTFEQWRKIKELEKSFPSFIE